MSAKGTKRGGHVLYISLSLLFLWVLHQAGHLKAPRFTLQAKTHGFLRPSCWELSGANDTLVVLRTSSTELEDRFRGHISTSLRCFKHYLIFSDLEEQFHGEHLLNSLSSVDTNIRNTHPDFDLYRRLQQHGRAGLRPSELSGSAETLAAMSGIVTNPGWKLDKWKFMPMINQTFHEYPDMKWYVFIEADTFLLWSMLLQYLTLLDHTNPYYIGSATRIGDGLFAHGGSGFVISQPAMGAVTEHYATHQAEIEALTDREWAGDLVLGKSLEAVGIRPTDAWPHFQGDYPGLVPYDNADNGRYGFGTTPRIWCRPTISYHHMSSDMIKSLWEFEQQWLTLHNGSDTLTNGDIFREYVMPQMMDDKADWDNLSDQDEPGVNDMEACRTRCEAQAECKQYSFTAATRQCKTRTHPRLGRPSNGTRSEWMKDRIAAFERDMEPCRDEGWKVPP